MASCPKCPCRFPVRPEPAPPEPPVEPLLIICPACHHEQPFAAVCDQCGVIFARYRRPERRQPVALPTPAEPLVSPKLLRKAVWPGLAVLGLLLLWILVKDLLPTTIVTVHDTLDVTSGSNHSAAVRRDGTVWTWGDNLYGQLGNGRRDEGHGQPEQVPGLSGFTALAAGDFFSVALKSDGTLWYFGDNFSGGSTNGGIWHDFARPRQINGIEEVIAVTCGRKSIVALKKNGTVWCWGLNTAGQCGPGTFGILWEPVQVAGLADVVAVAAGEQFSLALKKDGTVWGWGTLAIVSGTNLQRQSQPVPLTSLSRVAAIKAGYWLAVALKKDGTVWHSGTGAKPLPGEQRSPWDLLKRSKVAATAAIFAGGRDAFLEKRDGTLFCWGLNDFGKPAEKGKKRELTLAALKFSGTAAPQEALPPPAGAAEPESSAERYQAIAAGFEHSLALATDGTVWAWGENEFGQLASTRTGSANHPLQVCEPGGRPLRQVTSVAAGALYSLAVTVDGSLWIWGKNPTAEPSVSASRSGSNGQFSGSPRNAMPPTRIEGVLDAVAAAGGYGGTATFVVLHRNGTLSCFGKNDQKLPVLQLRPLAGVTDLSAIAAGARHFAALKRDGTVWTWGNNDSGQLGDGTTTSHAIPQRVGGIRDVAHLAAGNDATLVVKTDGTVWGWGKDIHAVLPKGLAVRNALTPRQIPELQDIVAVAMPGQGYTNGSHFLAVDRRGTVWSWGFNANGQLGQGTKGYDLIKKPAWIEGLDAVTALAAGGMHSLALCRNGTLRSWGKNSSGQLGNASGFDSAFPVGVGSGKIGPEKQP